MERIFISSLVRGDMAEIRQAARRGVETLEMHPVMFETEPARDEASRRALLDRLAACDAMVVLLGAEYGEPVARGMSPTEEEFNEARERGIPVLVLVQDIDREPAQQEFLTRVRGSWERGRLSSSFTDATDVGLALVKTLDAWRRERQGGEVDASSQDRALALARGDERPGRTYGGSKLRVVAVPAVSRALLDAVSLRDPELGDELAAAARRSHLIPQSAGLDATIGHDAVAIAVTGSGGFEQLGLAVGFDGAVVAEGPVGGDEPAFGGSVVMADRARTIIERSLAFAQAAWKRIDSRDEVRDVHVVLAVPEAEYKAYATEPVGGSMSMPSNMPHVLIAPATPLKVRRADLDGPETLIRLEAELQRAFELAGAVHPRR